MNIFIQKSLLLRNWIVSYTYTNTSFLFAHLVYLSKWSSPQQAQTSEALIEIRLLFAGIIHRVWWRRLCKRTRQRCPRGLLLGEYPAQWGASFGWRLWWQRMWKSCRGRTGWIGCRWRGQRHASFSEGKVLLCMGKVNWDRAGHPGYCGFHHHWHDVTFFFPFLRQRTGQQEAISNSK